MTNNELILEINNSPCLNNNNTKQTILTSEQKQYSSNYFSCYPNPFTDEITVSINSIKDQQINISISDMVGKIIFNSTDKYSKGKHLLSIKTSTIQPGTYIINLYNNEINESFKLVKKY